MDNIMQYFHMYGTEVRCGFTADPPVEGIRPHKIGEVLKDGKIRYLPGHEPTEALKMAINWMAERPDRNIECGRAGYALHGPGPLPNIPGKRYNQEKLLVNDVSSEEKERLWAYNENTRTILIFARSGGKTELNFLPMDGIAELIRSILPSNSKILKIALDKAAE